MSRQFCRICLVNYADILGVCNLYCIDNLAISDIMLYILNDQIKTFLDSRTMLGIIYKTYFAIFTFGDCHDNKTGVPTSGASRARAHQSSGRCSSRRTLLRQRLFRTGGPCSSTLRDAPKRANEGAECKHGRDLLRCFSRYLLPSAVGLRTRRRGRIDPTKEGATKRSQVDSRCLGIRLESTARRSRTQLNNSFGVGETAIQFVGTSSQYRACTGTKEKKTMQLAVADTLRQQHKAHLVSSYERLREQATNALPEDLSTGQQLFFQRGFAVWLVELCSVPCTARPAFLSQVSPTQTDPAPIIPDETNHALACLVASMIQSFLKAGVTL